MDVSLDKSNLSPYCHPRYLDLYARAAWLLRIQDQHAEARILEKWKKHVLFYYCGWE